MNPAELLSRKTEIEKIIRSTKPIFDARNKDVHFAEADEKSGHNDLVTKYDREVESQIHSKLEKVFAGEFMLGEESSTTSKPKPPDHLDHMWVLDPIDGTTNFFKGYPFYCSTISFITKDDHNQWSPVVACTWDPTRDEMFSAAKGLGSTLNDNRIQVSKNSLFSRGLFSSGFASTRGNPHETQSFEKFFDVTRQTLGVRRDAAAALDLAYVACGRTDGYWEWNLSPWDLAAGSLLVQESGGMCTNLDGEEPWDPFCGEIIATNLILHKSLLNALGSISR